MDFRPRPFQAETAAMVGAGKNPLLWGDTGVGKTYAALLAAEQVLNQGKVIFIANAITLMIQHVKTAHEWFAARNSKIRVGAVWGDTEQAKRPAIYANNDVIFMVGTFDRDFERGILPLRETKLVIIDEAQFADPANLHFFSKIGRILKQFPHIQRLALTGTILPVLPIMRALDCFSTIRQESEPAQSEVRHFSKMELRPDPTLWLLRREVRGRIDRIWAGIADQIRDTRVLPETIAGQQSCLNCIERLEAFDASLSKADRQDQMLDARLWDTRRRIYACRFLSELEYIIVCENLEEARRRLDEQIARDQAIKQDRAQGLQLMPMIERHKVSHDFVCQIRNLCAEGYLHPKDVATFNLLDQAVRRSWQTIVFCGRVELVGYLVAQARAKGLIADGIVSKVSAGKKLALMQAFASECPPIIFSTSALLYGIDLNPRLLIRRSMPVNQEQASQITGRVAHKLGNEGTIIALVLDDPLEQRLYHKTTPPAVRKRRTAIPPKPGQRVLTFV